MIPLACILSLWGEGMGEGHSFFAAESRGIKSK